MSDVAQEMGVSSGLLYSYVESKEALFHFALDWARSNGTKPAPELPIPTPGPGDTTALVAGVLRTGLAQPALREALRRERADDPATELTQIVIEHYRATNATRQLITMVDRSVRDIPELREQFIQKGRSRFVLRLAQYLETRIAAGQFRAVPDPEVTARFILESVAWFANHRYGDVDGASIDDEAAERTVVDMIVSALV